MKFSRVLLFAVSVIATEMQGTELIVNGSFEEPEILSGAFTVYALPGWTLNESVQICASDAWPSYQDAQSACLHGTNAGAYIEQTFPTESGKRYSVYCRYANNPDAETATFSIRLYDASVLTEQVLTHSGSIRMGMNYTLFATNVVANSPQTTIRFTRLSGAWGQAPVLDAVSVVPFGSPRVLVNGKFPSGNEVTHAGSAKVTMESTFANGVIYYTLDGSTPNFGSPIYSGEIDVTNSVVVRALGLDADTFDITEAFPVTVNIIPTYALSLSLSGSGAVGANPPVGPYGSNTTVDVTATPGAGWMFDHWSGDAGGSNNPVHLTMSGPLAVQAVFVQLFPVVAITPGGGSLELTPVLGPYPSNSVLSVSAIASNDWIFLRWQGDASGTNNPLSLTVNGPKSLAAVFGTTLDTSIIGSGAIQLNATNPIVFGAVVSATATPSPGWMFDHWSGDVSGSANPLNVTMSQPRNIQAVFQQLLYSVTTSTAGGGVVSVDPSAGPYPSYSLAVVSAIASNGWTFLNWKGDASGTNNPLNLVVDGPKSVSAVFGTSVGTAVIGSGSVELSKTEVVAYGTIIRATAVPNYGSYFVQWGSAVSGSNSPAEFAVTGTNPVHAVFANLQPGQAALSVRILGPGNVSVTPRQQVYSVGDGVTLTAIPLDLASPFNSWSGDVTDATNPLTLILNTSKVVTATFKPFTPELKIMQHAGTIQLAWPISALNYALETTTNLLGGSGWNNLDVGSQISVADNVSVELPALNEQQFFRLRSRPLIPVFQYAIFYNGLLEFSTAATMIINGRVHCNTNIYVGAGGGSTLTFNATVTASGTISAPNNAGSSWGSNWRTYFNGTPPYITNAPRLQLPIGTNNPHALIDLPPANESSTTLGQQRMYNHAQVVIVVSNSVVFAIIRAASNGQLPGFDPSPTIIATSTSAAAIGSKFPFLTLLWPTNKFYDQRENKTVLATQIDMGKYAQWINSNSSILGKFPVGSGSYPTILFVADKRTVAGSQMTGIRLTNGIVLPSNGGMGLSVITPEPLYVLGHYNCANPAYLGTTNTTATMPAALMSDALTILSGAWRDFYSPSNYTFRAASNTTVNAAIVTGNVPSTGTSSSTFSGGVHNLPRLLEDWNPGTARVLTLNASLVVLFPSVRATGVFILPGTYYSAPTRQFSHDPNFFNLSRLPPGTPLVMPNQ